MCFDTDMHTHCLRLLLMECVPITQYCVKNHTRLLKTTISYIYA